MKGAGEITTTYAANPQATHHIRGVCRLVIEPMTLRLDVAGLDLAADPGRYRDVSPSGSGEMVEAYSEDFETPDPGQTVEAEGYFVVPWSHTWDDWGGGQPTRHWTVLDIGAARRPPRANRSESAHRSSARRSLAGENRAGMPITRVGRPKPHVTFGLRRWPERQQRPRHCGCATTLGPWAAA